MSQLRHASGTDTSFPYEAQHVTFILICDGAVTQAKTRTEKRAAVTRAAVKGAVLLAAWPGQWSQDIFVVDDLAAASAALGSR